MFEANFKQNGAENKYIIEDKKHFNSTRSYNKCMFKLTY